MQGWRRRCAESLGPARGVHWVKSGTRLGELVGSNASVSLMGPEGDAADEIEANKIRRGGVDSMQYFAVADVTDIITSIGPGQYLVGNVQSVEAQGSYAGW
jgi:hypothetical protein